MRRLAVLAPLAGAVLLLVGLGLRRGSGRLGRTSTAKPPSLAEGGKQEERFDASGEESVAHRLHFRTESTIVLSLGTEADGRTIDTDLEISATVTVSRPRRDSSAAMRFSDVSLRFRRAGAEPSREQVANLIEEISQGFFVWPDASGVVREFGFPEGMDPTASIWIRQAVLSIQLSRPPEEASEWERDEELDLGWVRTKYERIADGKVAATRLRIIRTNEQGEMLDRADRVEFGGNAQGHYDGTSASWTSVDSETRLRATGPEPIKTIESRSEGHWRRIGPCRTESVAAKIVRRGVGEVWHAEENGRRRSPSAQGESFASLLARLRVSDTWERRVPFERNLADLFLADDRAAGEAEAALLAGLDRDTTGAIIAALGAAGTPAAQSALARVASHGSLDALVRRSALNSLAMAAVSDASAIGALRKLVQEDPSEEIRGLAASALADR